MRIKTITTITTITTIITLLPLMGFAQLDFDINDYMNDLLRTYNIESQKSPESPENIVITDFYLVWSANVYTPHDYQGRALPSIGSEVIVEAVVILSKGEISDLRYSWFIDTIFQEEKSGYGKSVFSFNVLQHSGGYHVIKAQVFNEDRTILIEKSVKIPIVEPELVINSSIISPGKEYSFIAKPYFFSITKLTDLTFEWHFSGQEPIISSDYDASILDLTITGKQDNEFLEKELWVSVQNKKETRQKASQTIDVMIY